MNIIITYDPCWGYKPKNQTPQWASLDTVDFVTHLLENVGYSTMLLRADNLFEKNLKEIKALQPNSLVFWLNEFMPTGSSVERFTAGIIEKVGMMYTGPSSASLGVGLNKETAKSVFRKLNILTPESVVVHPFDDWYVIQNVNWDGFAIIKPLLQGGSNGIDQFSVLYTDDIDSIRKKVAQIHLQFNEPALIERYIGGNDVREFSVPVLISHTGKIAEIPIIEIDLDQISTRRGKSQFLTQDFKKEQRSFCQTTKDKTYLKIPANLSDKIVDMINFDIGRIVKEIGCKDMARVDIRADSEGLHFIEVNVNPGKNKFSYLLMSAYYLGFNYSQIIGLIPYQALKRYGVEPTKKLKQLVKPVEKFFDTQNTHEIL